MKAVPRRNCSGESGTGLAAACGAGDAAEGLAAEAEAIVDDAVALESAAGAPTLAGVPAVAGDGLSLSAVFAAVPAEALLAGIAAVLVSVELLFPSPAAVAAVGNKPRETTSTHPKKKRILSSLNFPCKLDLEAKMKTSY